MWSDRRLDKEVLNVISADVKNHKSEVVKKVSLTVLANWEMEKISKVVKWQQSIRRLGTHNTKDVSEIAYSTKKLRKQKGGGCARARNKGAVQFRGGATIFGPDGRKYDYKINKKEKVLGLKHALSLKVEKKELFILDTIDFTASTVKALLEFKKIHGIKTNSLLLVDSEKNEKILKSINNIHEANFLPVVGINVLSVVENQILIMSENALKTLQERGVI